LPLWCLQTLLFNHFPIEDHFAESALDVTCSTSDTRRTNLLTNLVISHERGKDRRVLTTSGTYPWSFVTKEWQSKELS
jgi:hypothetical protein